MSAQPTALRARQAAKKSLRGIARLVTAALITVGLLVPALSLPSAASAEPAPSSTDAAKTPTSITVSGPTTFWAGEDVTVTATVAVSPGDPAAEGRVLVSFAAGPFTFNSVSAAADTTTINVGRLAPGTYEMTVTFEGGDNHLESTVQHTVTVRTPGATITNASVALEHSTVDVRTAMPATFRISGASGAPIAERAFSVAVFRYPDMTSPVFTADLESDSVGMGSVVIPPQPTGAYVVRIFVPTTTSHAPATHSSSYDVTPITTTTTLTISPLDPAGMRPAFTDITYTATVTPAMAGIPVNFMRTSLMPPASGAFGTAITDANGVATFTARTGGATIGEMLWAEARPSDPNISASTSMSISSSVGVRYASAVVTTPPTARMTETATSLNVIFPDGPAELAGSSVSVYRGATVVATEVVTTQDGVLRADFQVPAPTATGPDVLSFGIAASQPSIVTLFTHTTPTVWTLASQNLAIEALPSVDTMTSMPIAATVTDDGAPVANRALELTVYGVDGGLPLFTGYLTTSADGTAGAMIPPLPVGSYRATIAATATGVYDALLESVTFDVVPITSETSLTVSPTAAHGSDRTFTATIDGDNPTGTVVFSAGGDVIGVAPVANGVASLTLNSLDVGDHAIVAEYGGDARHAASQASLTATVIAWSSVVTTTLSATDALVGDAVEMVVTVRLIDPTITTVARAIGAAATASGTVALLIDGKVVGDAVALVDGAATLTVPSTTAGTASVAARFVPGDASTTGADSATHTLAITEAPEPTPDPEPTVEPTPEPPVKPTPAETESATPVPSTPAATAVPTPSPAPLAATGATPPAGLMMGTLLFVAGLALAAGRMVRRQRS